MPSVGDANSTDHPAPTFPQPGHPRFGRSVPAVFLCLASRFLSLHVLRRRPRGSFVRDVFRSRSGPATRAVFATWPGVTARRRSWDSLFPSQCSSDLRAVTPHRHDPAHLPFLRIHPPRVSSSRKPTRVERGSWVARPRLLGFARRSLKSAVPCHPPTPPWLLCTGSFVLTGQDCPGISISSLRSSASRLRPSLLKAIPPRLLDPPLATSLQRDERRERRPCPSALSGAVA